MADLVETNKKNLLELMGHHCSLAGLQKDPDQPSVEAVEDIE
jgi:hypothetical protein